MRETLIAILIVLIILVLGFIGFWYFMQWEFTNYNNASIGLLDPTKSTTDWIGYYTVLPTWANDAWIYTYRNGVFFQARYLD